MRNLFMMSLRHLSQVHMIRFYAIRRIEYKGVE